MAMSHMLFLNPRLLIASSASATSTLAVVAGFVPFFFWPSRRTHHARLLFKLNPIQPGSGSGSPRKRSITIDDRDRPEIGAPMDFSHLKHMRADEAKLTMYETQPHRHIVNSTVEGVGGMCDAFHRPTRRGGLQLMLTALRSFDNMVQNSS